ncbi:cob(I)yrinic acid a,c-diamide adenosyltransferase [Varunaivibrio sulfuroxidans]|uniref:Corrinoid adenosyltransferase n=1 Tax=Varunaivibrio sulfuroxidans TaxID=1773489 RepID=A0A4R3JC53_9PROT|nr:cob(I)yrinic acid a,c-diamide adenosyltransferase [Varunaivibrio sulfuroxidans]TCS63538.1 cob(I)alamin adenosyltransferase [Varunaivibrio sulfuroxidans]WES30317.1 cob(I)yrinic acid a,c-diamide adenosyltransferase [Varunaivibrio sulfuroxidans]
MVKLTKIYTRGGDNGQTSLTDGSRRDKHDLRVAAYGCVDEAGAAIGLARLHCPRETDALLSRIQNDLFDLGADLSTPAEGRADEGALRIVTAQVTRLEQDIDAYNAQLKPLNSFVLAGGSAAGAHLHFARTVVRRAERAASALACREKISAPALMYLNRLSDLLFVLARHHNGRGEDDVLWRPGAER